MLLRGGLAAFSKRFAFCTCGKGGEKTQSLPTLPAEVLAPDWGGSRPPALYLGTERCMQESTALQGLRIGVIINLSGTPAPKTGCKVLDVKATGAAADEPTARAREACAKLGRQSAPCMLYGPESALAAALFLVEVLPKAVNSKDAAISLIKQRYPAAELHSLAAQRLLAAAAGLAIDGCEDSQAADGPGGPRVAACPAPPPPQAGKAPLRPTTQQPKLLGVAPAAAPAVSRPPPRPANGNKIGNGSQTGNGNGTGTMARESAVAAEAFARLKKRDPKGAETALETLQAVLGHVLEKPAEEKFRRLKGSNARVKSEITTHPEAVQILRLAGFSLVGQDLVLAEHASLQLLQDVLCGLRQSPPTRTQEAGRRSI